MAIFILGGSNSLMKSGWVAPFSAQVPGTVNLSVGGTTTLTAIYRFLASSEIAPGDTVVWEYALNDANGLKRGYSPELLLRHLEHLIVLARERGVRFAPVIFTSRAIEQRPTRLPYYTGLLELLAHYRLAPFDMSTEYRAKLGRKVLPAHCFSDNAHYAHTEAILGFLVAGARRAVREAKVPADVPARAIGTQRIQLLSDFTDTRFENSAMSLATARAPLSVALPETGELAGLVYVTAPQNNALALRFTGRIWRQGVAVSAVGRTQEKVSAMLKTASLERAHGLPWVYPRGSRLSIAQWGGGGRLYSEHGCKGQIPRPVQEPVAHVAGVLVAIPPRRRALSDVALPPTLRLHLRALARRLRARLSGKRG